MRSCNINSNDGNSRIEVQSFSQGVRRSFGLSTKLFVCADNGKKDALDFPTDARVKQKQKGFLNGNKNPVAAVESGNGLGEAYAFYRGYGSGFYEINLVTFSNLAITQVNKMSVISRATGNCIACVAILNQKGRHVYTLAMPVLGARSDKLSLSVKSGVMASAILSHFKSSFMKKGVDELKSIFLFAYGATGQQVSEIAREVDKAVKFSLG